MPCFAVVPSRGERNGDQIIVDVPSISPHLDSRFHWHINIIRIVCLPRQVLSSPFTPLTGGWGDASCGGVFAPAIKQCGYDAIFISGAAEEPVYLFCDGKTTELRGAGDLWGLDATEAENALHKALDPVCRKKPCVACIGTAGEKRSLISGICNEGGRIAARSGVGAVMGSKKLKAVALAGSLPMPCHDSETVKALSKELGQKLLTLTLPSGLGRHRT